MNQLQALKNHTKVVADTGNFEEIERFAPQDATTNPSLILQAVQQPRYAPILREICAQHARQGVDAVMQQLTVRLGCEILQIVPGRVSTEVDARLSFDTSATLQNAREIVALYRAQGIEPERVLIKIAATWEGIAAARQLELEGVRTNLTLLFSPVQAAACAHAGVQLISPFVGRVYDWFKKEAGANWDEAAMAADADPGVRCVRSIYRMFKSHGVRTEIMGASFRNVGQILALAGCDLLTISPALLGQLQTAPQLGELSANWTQDLGDAPACPDRTEGQFRFALNEDAMATDRLAHGIRAFAADTQKLRGLIAAQM